jgi:hypothetical protein
MLRDCPVTREPILDGLAVLFGKAVVARAPGG